MVEPKTRIQRGPLRLSLGMTRIRNSYCMWPGVGNPVPSEPQGVLLFVFALRSATNSDPRTR